jgi:RNA polymerase sigma-70 factor (ECF subfamily)
MRMSRPGADILSNARPLKTVRTGNFSPGTPHYLTDVDDNDLITRARRGDAEAFTRLFARHQHAVFRYAAHMCGREHGDDIVQDTFLALLRQTARHDAPRGPVGAYLLGIARHLVLKRLGARYDARETDALDADLDWAPAAEGPTALDALAREELVGAVRVAVDALPPAYRETIVLCELEELDYAAAATVMACPIGTVRSRLHRARALLAASLADLAPAGAGAAHGTRG